jgi:hypothetical protein
LTFDFRHPTAGTRHPLACCRGPAHTQRVRTHGLDALSHFRGDLGETRPFSAGQVEHLQTIAAQADLVQDSFDVLDPAFGVYITFQVMAGAL